MGTAAAAAETEPAVGNDPGYACFRSRGDGSDCGGTRLRSFAAFWRAAVPIYVWECFSGE